MRDACAALFDRAGAARGGYVHHEKIARIEEEAFTHSTYD